MLFAPWHLKDDREREENISKQKRALLLLVWCGLVHILFRRDTKRIICCCGVFWCRVRRLYQMRIYPTAGHDVESRSVLCEKNIEVARRAIVCRPQKGAFENVLRLHPRGKETEKVVAEQRQLHLISRWQWQIGRASLMRRPAAAAAAKENDPFSLLSCFSYVPSFVL